jgi:pimeloyl-ACP methyl ester carboxylesterase
MRNEMGTRFPVQAARSMDHRRISCQRARKVASLTGCHGRCRAAALAIVALASTAMLVSGCGGTSTAGGLRSRLLTAADLPAGWSPSAATGTGARLANTPCLAGMASNRKGWSYQTAAFVEGKSTPNFGEVLATGTEVSQAWGDFDRALAGCRSATLALDGVKAKATVRRLAMARVGRSSSAYQWQFTLAGIRIVADLVLFQAGRYAGDLTYASLGAPQTATVEAFARAAAAKAKTGSTAPVPNTISIASAPVQTAHTSLGTVAYRMIGTGPPLVLISGFTGTMEGWDPRFIDTLAQHYRVVIFDNAGIGHTQEPAGPLTIDAMANQTSALISTLRLGRPSVLGWAMGSLIAQALAALHPSQVNRLILCATYPGNGTAARPPQSTIDAIRSGNPQALIAELFPPSQAAAGRAWLAEIAGYPTASSVPPRTVTAQAAAVERWWNGTDPAATKTATIVAPTLIADGTADRLDPISNSRTLAKLIHHARLELYPGAGHAFLFQDQSSFATLIKSFLHG